MYVCNSVQGTLCIQVHVENYAYFSYLPLYLFRLFTSALSEYFFCVFSSIFCVFVLATVAPTRCQRS